MSRRENAAAVRRCAFVAALALCASRGAAQVYSSLLPAFSCARQDASCAALGDAYVSLGGATSPWRNTTGWAAAAAGTPTEYCAMAGLWCTGGNITRMCVAQAAKRCNPGPPARVRQPGLTRPLPWPRSQLFFGTKDARDTAELIRHHHLAAKDVRCLCAAPPRRAPRTRLNALAAAVTCRTARSRAGWSIRSC